MGSLEIRELSYRYNAGSTDALRGISFDVMPGEFIAVLGPNRAGKSTLAKLILRTFLRQQEGVQTGDIRLNLRRMGTAIGWVFDDISWMFCNLYVEDEIAFGPENCGMRPDNIRSRVRELLTQIGLVGFERRTIMTLSGGEAQKVGIAAALAAYPEFLVTDDLFSSVDVASRKSLMALFHDYRAAVSDSTWIDFSREWSDSTADSDRIVGLTAGELSMQPTPTRWLLQNVAVRDLQWANDIYLPFDLDVARRGVRRAARPQPTDYGDTARALWSVVSHDHNAQDTSTTPTSSGLEADALSFSYRDGTRVLRDCSVFFSGGTLNILAGRNGSGKSTLAKICAGLLRPSAGRIVMNGHALTGAPLRVRVAIVFQTPEYHFLADSVVGELEGSARTADDIRELLCRVGLSGMEERNPFLLTLGEKRRLAIAIALARRPQVLFVDEPTLGQDERHATLLASLFHELCRAGTTVIAVTHDARFIYSHGGVIHILADGQIKYSGSVPAVFRRDAQSDFAGLSPVLNRWMEFRGSVDGAPRSVAELIKVVDDGA